MWNSSLFSLSSTKLSFLLFFYSTKIRIQNGSCSTIILMEKYVDVDKSQNEVIKLKMGKITVNVFI